MALDVRQWECRQESAFARDSVGFPVLVPLPGGVSVFRLRVAIPTRQPSSYCRRLEVNQHRRWEKWAPSFLTAAPFLQHQSLAIEFESDHFVLAPTFHPQVACHIEWDRLLRLPHPGRVTSRQKLRRRYANQL